MDILEKREKLNRLKELQVEANILMERHRDILIEQNDILRKIVSVPVDEFMSDLDDSDFDGLGDGTASILRITK